MTATEKLRALVRGKMLVECGECGLVKRTPLRDAAAEIGIPMTVLYRFLSGKEITSGTFDALTAWIEKPQ